MRIAVPTRGVFDNIPGILTAFSAYKDAYKRVKPALQARGGMAATLRVAPELAANLDRWMNDNGAAMIIPVRRCCS
jgi:xanthine dehydrogenase iron-sulfur cluster and FAD-binding subunit A